MFLSFLPHFFDSNVGSGLCLHSISEKILSFSQKKFMRFALTTHHILYPKNSVPEEGNLYVALEVILGYLSPGGR
jgi:hypothetical protein